MSGRQRLQREQQIVELLVAGVAADAQTPAELLQHRDARPPVGGVDHQVHRAAGCQHGPQRAQPRVGVGKVMQDSRADDLIERRSQRRHLRNRQLAHREVVEAVLALQRLRVADAGGAEVDARDARARPAQRDLCRLRRTAARHQDRGILPQRPRRPQQVMLGAAPLVVLPETPVPIEAVDRRRVRTSLVERLYRRRDDLGVCATGDGPAPAA